MAKMRAVEVQKPKGPFTLVEKEIPVPGPDQVRIQVKACGICHSDAVTKEGLFPHITYPRIPGHEVAGVIDAIGSNVKEWSVGQRVGIGWHGGHCGHCSSCRKGDFITCHSMQTPGVTYDGGYADYMVAPTEALALIPDELSYIDAGPLMCAGMTTFNALRHSGAKAGDVVAILGIGGLGHLGIQFATKMGFKTIAIARGKEKEALAKRLGAFQYIDSTEGHVGQELMKLGGAKVILATVTNAESMNRAIKGLAIDGKLIVLGVAFEPMQLQTLPLMAGRRSVSGWLSGTSSDSQDTMAFSALTNIRSMNEVFPLEKASDAYERMMSGEARFRIVLSME